MDPPPQAEPAIGLQYIGRAYTPIHDDHEEKYGVPTLTELGNCKKNSTSGMTRRFTLGLVKINKKNKHI